MHHNSIKMHNALFETNHIHPKNQIMSTSLETLQLQVQQLLDRQAIHDCIARYGRGVDRFDRELILSAFHADALDEHGKFVGKREEFADWALAQHSKAHLSTQHCLMNHRCELDGNTAHAETYFMFVSMNKEGKPLNLNGGRYVDRLEKREGVWGIVARKLVRDWADMAERPDMDDLSSMTSTRGTLSAEMRAFMNGGQGTKRNRSDPSYERPLTVDAQRAKQYKQLPANAR